MSDIDLNIIDDGDINLILYDDGTVNVSVVDTGDLNVTFDGISSFQTLSDTPISYTGKSGKTVTVNSTEDGVEFSSAGSGNVSTSGTPVDNDFAKFTDASTIEGRSYSEVRTDLNIEDGADVTDATNVASAGAAMSGGAFHDGFSDFVADEHLNWKNSVGTIHAGNYTNTTYAANQVLDWTADQGATNINAGNYTNTGDTTAHASFSQLDYASAGHTGFAPALTGDQNYVTDDDITLLGNTTNTNSGDQDISGIGTNTTAIGFNTTHRGLTNNPHSVDKTDVGLSNVPNVDTTNASNISSGTLSSAIIPPVALTTVQVAVSQVAQLALTTEEGDVVVRSDENKSYMRNDGTAEDMTDFTELQTPTDTVLSVNSETGTVVLTTGDIGVDADSNYVTDAQVTLLGQTTNTNSGDNAVNSNYSGLVSNVTTNLSEGTNTETTVKVASSDGTDATMVSASTSRAGLLTKAKWDEIVANSLKATNIAHPLVEEAVPSGAVFTDTTYTSSDFTHNSLNGLNDGTDYEHLTATQVAALHAESHDIASHNDTTATGTELNTLTDNSVADTLHRHSELVASDGSLDPAVSVDASGNIGIGTTSPDYKLEVIGSFRADSFKTDETTSHTVFVGDDAGGTGTFTTFVGEHAGQENTGAYSNAVGSYALYSNTGANSNAVGFYALYSNTGTHSNALGSAALYYNDGDHNTAFGDNAFNTWTADTGNALTVESVDFANNRVTITGHGITGSQNFKASTTGTLPAGLSATENQWLVIDANTLECKSGTFSDAGTGTLTLTPKVIYTNSTALGYNAEPDASNQAVIGDSALTQVKTAGSIYSTGTGDNYFAGNVGIDTTAPTSTLHTNGSIACAYIAKTATYTLTANDFQLECTANTFTVTLPTAVGIAGRIYSIKNSGAGTITVAGDGTENIDGANTQTLAQWDNLKVVSNNVGWIII